MSNFSKIEPRSRTELVVGKITSSIINGELHDGELLPPENKLCEVFGVSRSILRESMRVLASKGLIEIKQGYGTTVCLPKDDIPEEALNNYLLMNFISPIQLMEVRMPIEIEIAKLAAVRRNKGHLDIMKKSLKIMQFHPKDLDICVNADDEFHKAIVDATENSIFGIIIRSIMRYLHISRRLTISNFGIDGVIAEHRAILKSIKEKDVESATISMKKHMEVTLYNLKRVGKYFKEKNKENS